MTKTQYFDRMVIKTCDAVVKENADSENAKKYQFSKVVCPTFWDRPLLCEKFAQIRKIDGDIYSFSFSAVGM